MNKKQLKIKSKAFRINKKGENIDDCQDSFAYNSESNRYAISDGASRSFFPYQWANCLVEYFCNNEDEQNKMLFIKKKWEDWLNTPQEQWKKEIQLIIKPETLYLIKNRYYKKESAVATFVGIEFIEALNNFILNAMIVGDSCLFHVNENYESYLLKKSDEFDSYPNYFASYKKDNNFTPEFIEIPVKTGDCFILTSDAMANWILKHKEESQESLQSVSDLIFSIETEDDFKTFIKNARNNEKPLENDDVVLVIINVESFIISSESEKKNDESENRNIISNKKNYIENNNNETTEQKLIGEEVKNKFIELENKIKSLSFFNIIFFIYFCISIPFNSFIFKECRNLNALSTNLYKILNNTNEKIDTIILERSIQEDLTKKEPDFINKSITKPNKNVSSPSIINQTDILLKKGTALYDENYKLISKIKNNVNGILFSNPTSSDIFKQIQLDLWVIKEWNFKTFTNEIDNKIYIKENVNTRKELSFSKGMVVLTLQKGSYFSKIDERLDNRNNIWFKIRLNCFIKSNN